MGSVTKRTGTPAVARRRNSARGAAEFRPNPSVWKIANGVTSAQAPSTCRHPSTRKAAFFLRPDDSRSECASRT